MDSQPHLLIHRFKGRYGTASSVPEVRVVLDRDGRLAGLWIKPWQDANAMIAYRHTQFGTVNVIIIIAILPLVFLPAWMAGAAPFAWLILLFLLGILALFHSLTVTIDDQNTSASASASD